MNNDLVSDDFIKDEVGIRRDGQPADRGIVGASANERIVRQERDESLNARLNASRGFWGTRRDAVEHDLQVGECGAGVAYFQRLCFAQTARTSLSVANSPHAAAARDAAIAVRSSAVKAIRTPSPPASCSTSRAISSCISGGRLRAASTARSSRVVMQREYASHRRGESQKNGRLAPHGNSPRICLDLTTRSTPIAIAAVRLETPSRLARATTIDQERSSARSSRSIT
jgi:hypothetical protein